ncbi:NAD(P)-binding protein [Trichoderma longibrachiatum ATCC 18648]|uniref:NAD(P)-binding protein n=1 Tax=Trichoderma longibrachiatum ATCC 18648 TaxID=983965 RepID=A0A2T4C6C8_TRILO|nr:NAD(P)-binding protein [Trichoderma longibrachiatum ATCC 18648]
MANATGKKAVHFGAGNIGRGFVACFLHNSGYEVVFADVNGDLIDTINSTPSYKVIEVGSEGTSENVITNYRAINSRTHEEELVEEIRTADVVTCSVGPNILKFIAPVIAKGIDRRSDDETPLHVIACENAIGATDTLASYIKDAKNTDPARLETHHQRARYANSAIDRIVPAQDPNAGLDVKLEKFFEWVVDKTPFEDIGIPPIEGIQWVDNLEPFIERKLYTVNTGHATAAYHGYYRRKRTVYDALQDKEAVERVGRAPLRKLSRKERFIGPAAEAAENDMPVKFLLDAIEMTFRFQDVEGDDESKELSTIMSENSAEDVVAKVCGIKPTEKIYPRLVEVVKRVQADSQEE